VPNEIFDGGPPSALEVWLRLRKPNERPILRLVILVAAITWLPLLVLTALHGDLVHAPDSGAFLQDFAVNARFLLALPVLVISEAICIPRFGAIARQFAESDLIRDSERLRFEAILASTRRLRDWKFAEIVVVIVAYLIVAALMKAPLSHFPAWHRAADGAGYSAAGWWALLVSLPLLLIFQLGWLWRLVLWYRMLWLISRLDLHLLAAHPDRAGGLLFVGFSLRTWALPALAISVTAAGAVANRIMHEGHSPFDYKYQVLALAVSLLILYTAPLTVFYRNLLKSWRLAMPDYAVLAGRVGHELERNWFKGRTEPFDEDPLQTSAFSATTDLYQVVANAYEMRFVPVDVQSVIYLAVVALLPFVPVLLISEPLDVIFKSLASFLV
jgi:hypothetical protein